MYIGTDLHKETCYATTLDKECGIIDRIRAEANSHSCEGRQRCDNTNCSVHRPVAKFISVLHILTKTKKEKDLEP